MSAAVDLPLPTLPADRSREVLCHCGSHRRDHAGRKNLGHCRGHAQPDVTPAEADLPAHLIIRSVACPDGCRRFWPAKGERLRLRAIAAADEDLITPLAEADKRRPRSRKSEDARAEGHFGVGPSDIGACRKQIEYRENPPEDFVPIEVDRAAAYEGTLLHEGITKARRLRYPWRKFALQVHVPGLDRPGELDEWDPVTATIVDYKSAGDWKWEVVGTYGPPEKEWEQLLMYGLAVEAMGHPVETIELHYYRRENFRDNERFVRPFDRAAALRAVQRLHSILDDLHAGRELPRDEPGPSLSALCRSFCPAVLDCWQVEEAELHRRSPEGWLLAREDPEIEAALGRYLDAHEKLYKPGDDSKKREKVLVEGAPFGRYGPFTYSQSGGNTSWVDDLDARRDQFEQELTAAAIEQRPPAFPDQLPVPQKQVTTRIQNRIARVRKAILEAEARAAAKAAEGDDA